jgi:hypothetical protein
MPQEGKTRPMEDILYRLPQQAGQPPEANSTSVATEASHVETNIANSHRDDRSQHSGQSSIGRGGHRGHPSNSGPQQRGQQHRDRSWPLLVNRFSAPSLIKKGKQNFPHI